MSVRSSAVNSSRRTTLLLAVALGLMLGSWVVGNPRSSGPDEPSHMVASAGFVRLQGRGTEVPGDPTVRLMRVPAMVGEPNPWCYALQPETPVSCTSLAPGTELIERQTTSFNYPVWGLLVPGVASFLPWAAGYAYIARALQAIMVLAMLVWTLLALLAKRPVLASAAAFGATPIAWFTFGVVNPSALSIAGGLALLTGLLIGTRSANWLALTGWLAVVLVRRDGPLWASVIVLIACALLATTPAAFWSRLRPSGQILVAVSVATALVPVLLRRDGLFNVALALAPMSLLVVDRVVRHFRGRRLDRRDRTLLTIGGIATGVGVVVVAALIRPGGFDAQLVQLVIGNTTEHLYQLVGLLGWLDTPVPPAAVLLFWAMFGGLVTVAWIDRPRSALVALGGLATIVVAAWALELGQGSSYGEYWQGRYSMPVAIGLPLVAVWRTKASSVDRLRPVLATVFFVVVNAAMIAAQHRWAVGTYGSWLVWRWDTWGSPIPPSLIVAVHLAATAGVAYIVGWHDTEVWTGPFSNRRAGHVPAAPHPVNSPAPADQR